MSTFCLTQQAKDKFKKALVSREINPMELQSMDSETRRSYLEGYVGKENAVKVNALFESKLLLKNQKAGMIAWAEKVGGIKPEVRRDLISKIEKMENVLNPQEEKAFLQDLANTRLGINVTQEEASTISTLAKKIKESESAFDTKTNKWSSEDKRLEYGWNKVQLENYINEVKLKGKPFDKTAIITETPGILKSLQASLDNSFFGRQGIKVLYLNPKIWASNFLKSWATIGREIQGKDALDLIKADIYSRPNAVNGKYRVGGYGLDVLSEEAYPSSLPSRIPLLGRLFKASESAYNGSALRIRADLADQYIKLAEQNGLNMLDPAQAKPLGRMIGSLTGRGSLGKADVLAKEANVLFYSVKFLKSNIDTLLAPSIYVTKKVTGQFDSKAEELIAKESAKATLRIVAGMAALLTIAKLFDPESVDEDPRSTNFGKIKIFGKWTDITGGMGGLVTLAARLATGWSKNANGEWTNYDEGKFGQANRWTAFVDFFSNKLSPVAGLLRDRMKNQLFGGKAFTWGEAIKGLVIPLPVQTADEILKDPKADFKLGTIILEGLGFSSSSYLEPNTKTEILPTNKKIANRDFIETVATYALAMGTDPETAFDRIFKGERIRKVTGDAIIVERIPVNESEAIKKKANAQNPLMKLDHTIPLQLGGSNDPSNLKVVTTADWRSYTQVENALGKALKDKKIGKDEAQKIIIKFKSEKDPKRRKEYGEKIKSKYK